MLHVFVQSMVCQCSVRWLTQVVLLLHNIRNTVSRMHVISVFSGTQHFWYATVMTDVMKHPRIGIVEESNFLM